MLRSSHATKGSLDEEKINDDSSHVAFVFTYRVKNFDVVKKTLNGEPIRDPLDRRDFLEFQDRLDIKLAIFFGVPVYYRGRGQHNSFDQQLKNFFLDLVDYPIIPAGQVLTPLQKVGHVAKGIAMGLLNIVAWPFKIARNILKIVTEFLPAWGKTECMKRGKKARENWEKWGWRILGAVCTLFFWVGRALTSAKINARAAYEIGLEFGEKQFGKGSFAAKVVANIAKLASWMVTGLWAVILFPLAIHAFAIHVAPILAVKMPAVIMHAIHQVGIALEPIVTATSQFLGPMTTPILTGVKLAAKWASMTFASHVVSLGVVGILSSAFGVGSLLNYVLHKVNSLSCMKPVDEYELESEEVIQKQAKTKSEPKKEVSQEAETGCMDGFLALFKGVGATPESVREGRGRKNADINSGNDTPTSSLGLSAADTSKSNERKYKEHFGSNLSPNRAHQEDKANRGFNVKVYSGALNDGTIVIPVNKFKT